MNCVSSEVTSLRCPIAEICSEFKELKEASHADLFGDDGSIKRHLQLSAVFDAKRGTMDKEQTARGVAALAASRASIIDSLETQDAITQASDQLEATYDLNQLRADCPNGVILAENRHGEILRSCGSTAISEAQRQDTERTFS